MICDRCGVEVTQAKVRRERMGHVELAVPVSHIWFFKGVPSRIGHLLDMSVRELERVLYYESYMVIDPGNTGLKEKELLSEDMWAELTADPKNSFEAKMGAEAIRDLLSAHGPGRAGPGAADGGQDGDQRPAEEGDPQTAPRWWRPSARAATSPSG